MKTCNGQQVDYISEEYLAKHFLAPDGLAHIRTAGEPTKGGRHHAYTDTDIEEIKICLACKRKDCTGGAACFRKRGAKA